jgi:hypothetical protein
VVVLVLQLYISFLFQYEFRSVREAWIKAKYIDRAFVAPFSSRHEMSTFSSHKPRNPSTSTAVESESSMLEHNLHTDPLVNPVTMKQGELQIEHKNHIRRPDDSNCSKLNTSSVHPSSAKSSAKSSGGGTIHT